MKKAVISDSLLNKFEVILYKKMTTNLLTTLSKFQPLDKNNLKLIERKTQLEQRKYKRPHIRDSFDKFEKFAIGFTCLFAFYVSMHLVFALVMGRF